MVQANTLPVLSQSWPFLQIPSGPLGLRSRSRNLHLGMHACVRISYEPVLSAVSMPSVDANRWDVPRAFVAGEPSGQAPCAGTSTWLLFRVSPAWPASMTSIVV